MSQKERIKEMIIERLELDISVSEISDDMPLFEEGLGLDSVEALEIVVGLETEFGIRLVLSEDPQSDFYCVNAISDMVDRCLVEEQLNE